MTDFALYVLQLAFINLLLALALSLYMDGFGYVVFHLVGIAGTSAYCYAIMLTQFSVSWFISAVCSILLAAIAGRVCAALIGQLRGDALTLATFAIGIAFFEAFRFVDITGGVFGISGIPRWGAGRSTLWTCMPGFVCGAIGCAIVLAWRRSLAGGFAAAIRADEWAAVSLGIRVTAQQYALGMVAGAMAGLSGVLLAGTNGFLEPRDFRATLVLMPLAAVVVARGRTPLTVGAATTAIVVLSQSMRFLGTSATIAGPVSEIVVATLLGGSIISFRLLGSRESDNVE